MKNLVNKARHKGFVGPHYSGVIGKVRFMIESFIARDELIMAVEPATLLRPTSDSSSVLKLHKVRSFAELAPFADAFDRAYYHGYIRRWEAPFTWGERVVLGTVDGQLASYNWVQEGTQEGFPTYYGPLLQDEARLLRGGVLPNFRNAGLNRAMKLAIVNELFDRGVRRVFVESYLRNVPSVRSIMSLGFRAIGLVTVLELGPLQNFVRWRSHAEMQAALDRVDIQQPLSSARAVRNT